MPVPLVFNDLSVNPASPTVAALTTRIRQLSATSRIAFQRGAERGLRVRQDFLQKNLCIGAMTILQWLAAADIDEIESTFIKDLVGTLHYIDEPGELCPDCDFSVGGSQAVALGICYMIGGIAISFDSELQWRVSNLHIRKNLLLDDGNIAEAEVGVKHAISEVHIIEHREWLRRHGNLEPFSEQAARIHIIDQIEELEPGASGRLQVFLGPEFLESAARNGFWSANGMQHLLAESCARILLENPKNELNAWCVVPVVAGWNAFRTHLSKSGPGYRLMFWVTNDERTLFANVGPKFEEYISPRLPPDF